MLILAGLLALVGSGAHCATVYDPADAPWPDVCRVDVSTSDGIVQFTVQFTDSIFARDEFIGRPVHSLAQGDIYMDLDGDATTGDPNDPGNDICLYYGASAWDCQAKLRFLTGPRQGEELLSIMGIQEGVGISAAGASVSIAFAASLIGGVSDFRFVVWARDFGVLSGVDRLPNRAGLCLSTGGGPQSEPFEMPADPQGGGPGMGPGTVFDPLPIPPFDPNTGATDDPWLQSGVVPGPGDLGITTPGLPGVLTDNGPWVESGQTPSLSDLGIALPGFDGVLGGSTAPPVPATCAHGPGEPLRRGGLRALTAWLQPDSLVLQIVSASPIRDDIAYWVICGLGDPGENLRRMLYAGAVAPGQWTALIMRDGAPRSAQAVGGAIEGNRLTLVVTKQHLGGRALRGVYLRAFAMPAGGGQLIDVLPAPEYLTLGL